jgi:hypothetical protein
MSWPDLFPHPTRMAVVRSGGIAVKAYQPLRKIMRSLSGTIMSRRAFLSSLPGVALGLVAYSI